MRKLIEFDMTKCNLEKLRGYISSLEERRQKIILGDAFANYLISMHKAGHLTTDEYTDIMTDLFEIPVRMTFNFPDGFVGEAVS